MSLLSEVGTFTEKLTTGSQTITLANSSITPKIILFMSSNLLADGRSTQHTGIIGFWADDSNAQGGIAFVDNDAQATMITARRFSNAKVFFLAAPADGSELGSVGSASVTSVAAGSFELNWTAVQGDARLISYIVLGGSDITNVDLNFITAATSDTTVSHNIGFQPDCAISFGAGTTSIPAGLQEHSLRIGVYDGTTQIALGASSVDNVADAKTNCRLTSGKFIDSVYDDAERNKATIAFDSDGYDITWDWTSGSANYYAILAIKGIRAKAVLTTTPTGTGTQNVTGAPDTPVAALLFTAGNANSNIANDIAMSIGFGANASQQANCSWTSDDGEPTSVTDRSQEQDEVLQMPAMNGAAPTEEANWGGVTATGFDLNWTSADSTQRNFAALMFIPASVSGSASFNFTAAGGGTADFPGSGSASFNFTVTAGGSPDFIGSGTGSVTFTAAAGGSADFTGSGASSFNFTADASGASESAGSGSVSFSFTAEGEPFLEGTGNGSASFSFTAAADGASESVGSGSASFSFTVDAGGTADGTGSGAGSFSISVSAGGMAESTGSGSGSFSFTALGEPLLPFAFGTPEDGWYFEPNATVWILGE